MEKIRIKRSGIRKSKGEMVFEVVVYAIATIFCIYCLFPFAIILGSSFETEANFAVYGFPIIPRDFTLQAYKVVLGDVQIFRAYGVTIFTTVAGTVFSMFLTMLFGGGLVPSYLLITKNLGLKDNILVLILPVAFGAWNMFLMRNFFNGIPHELSESAYMDGANDFQILWKIVLPVSVPGIATLSLFYALGYWNQWFNAMLYLDDNKLFPLQYLLMRMLRNADAMREMARSTGIAAGEIPTNSLRMATTVVAIGPIIFLYPYVQKYFTSGLTVGAIKG